ncbi:hypothetical protein [Streptomyces qinglanensis]|uniref:Uncharacterized protein n=1 Tax=Streptomyces qinglanensis TaxID=943816 RepID=A0A1H9U253_9ACTN|nr:hypothetical protein [Streptomyces qinglanensis]SES03526.1 hypothetical protein SAMN05421870_107245 [Streptomyces qinglanensis]
MARLQILELPEVEHADGTYETPFALVVDDLPLDCVAMKGELDPRNDQWQSLAERVGARAVLVFEETVEIPANDVTDYLVDDQFRRDMTAWTDVVTDTLAKIQSAVEIPKIPAPIQRAVGEPGGP